MDELTDNRRSYDELIEIAEKCANINEDWCCASCKLKDDLYCRDKIILALLDGIKKYR